MAEDDLEQRLRVQHEIGIFSASLTDGFKPVSYGDAADRLKRYREALAGLLDRYVGLVNCGDCGFWNPEEEAEVIAARQVLRGEA